MTTIVTLTLDAASQAAFDHLRETHYPAHLNRIAAHLTLFHALPDDGEIEAALARAAKSLASFPILVSGLMSLGRGVALAVQSPELIALQGGLAQSFHQHLIPQDKQKFRPHVVIQNKTSGDEARALLATLSVQFTPWQAQAEGLTWWNYLGGPWELRKKFHFI